MGPDGDGVRILQEHPSGQASLNAVVVADGRPEVPKRQRRPRPVSLVGSLLRRDNERRTKKNQTSGDSPNRNGFLQSLDMSMVLES